MATDLAEAGDKGEQVMDTFTNDERREVAEVLRGLRHTTYYSEEVVENIKDAIGMCQPWSKAAWRRSSARNAARPSTTT